MAGDLPGTDSRSGGSSPGGIPAIAVTDLVRDYRRPRQSVFRPGPVVHAVRSVSFTVAPGERFGIVGESGCGKSTVLRILAGLDQPSSPASSTVDGASRSARRPERRLRLPARAACNWSCRTR
jgi:ABC-type glutathione transport system ATPase component